MARRFVGVSVLILLALIVGMGARSLNASELICDGKAVGIVGSEEQKVLETTSGDDVVVLNGSDTVIYEGGTDVVCQKSGEKGDVVAFDPETSEDQ